MPSTQIDRIDGLTTSVAVKAPCRVATTAAITLSGLQTIDGVALADSDRVLVKNQTSPVANGIYISHATTWERALDFDGARDVVDGTSVYVRSGASTGLWRVNATDNPIIIGSSSITFTALVILPAIAVLDAKTMGAKGDGTTDDTAALQSWLTALGSGYYESTVVGPRVGFLPAGTYKTTATLTIPVWTSVLGVKGSSIIRPTSALSGAAVVVGGAARFEDIVVDGTNAGSGKTGVQLGASGQCIQPRLAGIITTGWSGAGGVGFDIQETISGSIVDCVADGNRRGWLIRNRSGGGPPDNTQFVRPVGKSNTDEGFTCFGGVNLTFDKLWAENNGLHGFYGNHDANVQDCRLRDPHFESNQLSLASGAARNADYNMFLRGKRWSVIGGYNDGNGDAGTSARALQFDNAIDFLIDDHSIPAGSIQNKTVYINSGSRGTVSNWPVSNGGYAAFDDNATFGDVRYFIDTKPRSFIVSTLPSAANVPGLIVYVSNEAGGAVPCFSDGTNWRRVTDRAIAS